MAAGPILTLLSSIPWGSVVENAPKVAEGAAKLWNSVSRGNKPQPAPEILDANAPSVDSSDISRITVRLENVELGVQTLNEQMESSSALIKELAEQNSLLVQRIELNRLRLLRYTGVLAILVLVLVGINVYVILSR